ncbi:MAG: AAA family ATPase [Candidatus Altiarchaeales archaeon]|nr:AAA family ATPase [Candidatus Altiarchaeales archaeon]
MRINRYRTLAYAILDDALSEAEQYFQSRRKQIQQETNTQVKLEREYVYLPVMVFAAHKRDNLNPKSVGRKKNLFHIDLSDGNIITLHSKSYGESFKSLSRSTHALDVEKHDILIRTADLTPKALNTLGYLMEQGTTNLERLDHPTRVAVQELLGRKFAVIYNPKDKESIIESAFREFFEMQRISDVFYVQPNLRIPGFTSKLYNLSANLHKTDQTEESYVKQSIKQSPEKIGLLLSVLFSAEISVQEIIYAPHVKAKFIWRGGLHEETRFVGCKRDRTPTKPENPIKLPTVNIGIKGHGVESIPIESVSINFSNVAGMSQLKEEIRQAIIYPLLHPELSEEYGSPAGGGVLFYGPPGCGKTYIVRATVGETGYNFFSASIQDIVGAGGEEAVNQLHQVFAEAREGAPSILFFDELDALGGRRESSKSGVERLIINQFLTEMEGVGEENKDVLVLGASNAPWDIDPALRRAGRFTKQIFVGPPDRQARVALLKMHLKDRPLGEDIDLNMLADLTKEYSSADVTALCDMAAKIPWSESIHGESKRPIEMNDFRKVLRETQTSLTAWLRLAEKQLRISGEDDMYPELAEYIYKRAGGIEASEKKKITFQEVGGLTEVKKQIKSKIVYPLRNPELAREYGRRVGGGILLYGPPGCGKTYIARATAGECEASFYNIKLTDLLSPQQGASEKQLHAIFERASRNTPSIIFFDEIDAVASKRSADKSGTERRLVNQLLTEMDGFESREGVMVLAATNLPWEIDPALRRAGRFSDQIYVPPPDAQGRKEILRINCEDKPVAEGLDYGWLSDETHGLSSADLTLVCDEASKIAWQQAMEEGVKRKIDNQDFDKVLRSRDTSIGPWFNQARKALNDSGEMKNYPELVGSIRLWEKKHLKKQMKIIKGKRDSGEIDQAVYDGLLKDLEAKMLAVETELG